MKNRDQLLKITTAAVMIALTCVLTMLVRIPSPTKGYLNLGDCAVLFGGWLLGPIWGTIAGGVGSAFADFFAGYPLYIPATLIIKGLMALIVATVPASLQKRKNAHLRIGLVISSAAAEVLMVAGYWLYEATVIGEGFVPALAGVPGNAVQGIVGAAGSYIFVEALSHTGFFKLYGIRGFAKGQIK